MNKINQPRKLFYFYWISYPSPPLRHIPFWQGLFLHGLTSDCDDTPWQQKQLSKNKIITLTNTLLVTDAVAAAGKILLAAAILPAEKNHNSLTQFNHSISQQSQLY